MSDEYFQTASGEPIRNEGEQRIPVVTPSGQLKGMTFRHEALGVRQTNDGCGSRRGVCAGRAGRVVHSEPALRGR